MKAIGYDIDWIYTLGTVNIHALSGGGRLPVIYADMDEADIDLQIEKALSSNQLFEVELNPNLDRFISVTEKQATDILASFKPVRSNLSPMQQYIERFYSRPFARFASKGYISFDKTNLNDPTDCHYHIVAYPKTFNQLALVLPEFNQSLNMLLSTSLDLSTVIEFAELK